MKRRPAVGYSRRVPDNDRHCGRHVAASLPDPHRGIPSPSSLIWSIVIPQKVLSELSQPQTPASVKSFAMSPPVRLEVRAVTIMIDSALDHLEPGEREAISLALELNADALLIDDNDGQTAAQLRGVSIMGTLRVLFDAAAFGLCDLEDTFGKLRQTNFHASEILYQHFL